MIREELLALADELEGIDVREGCRTCPAYEQPECRVYLPCTEIVAKYYARKMREAVERDGEGATTVSAYDLLPDEDSKEIAWVREHGGLGAVENPEIDQDKRVNRPAPKVLDADGVEIRVGDTVYGTVDMEYRITSLSEYDPSVVYAKAIEGGNECGDELIAGSPRTNSFQLESSKLTHKRPVLDADGEPIKEGDTVYLLPGEWCGRFPCLWFYGGEELNVLDLSPKYGEIGSIKCCKAGKMTSLCYPKPSQLTHAKHEPPDTYAKLYEDVHDERCGSEEFVRRCRALAERSGR